MFFCDKYKSRKLNNCILYANIVSASSSQKCWVSSLKDANNIDIMGKLHKILRKKMFYITIY